MAVSGLNTSNIVTDANGRTRIIGGSSSIDSKAIIDTLIKAKRAPAVDLESKITKNNTQVSELTKFKTTISAVTTALDKLRAAPGSSNDVFQTKIATGSTVADVGAPSGFQPSEINSLVLTSVQNTAQPATHTIKINALAAAHQIRGDALTSTNTSLSSLGLTTGTFTINGQSITISSTDTLLDLRSKINTAGAAGANVNATIVSADATTNYLVLTSTKTGTSNQLNFGGDSAVTNSLGFTTGGAFAIKTPLTAAANASIDVNGITGIVRQSNQIDDVITGVSLSLLKAEANTKITLKVEPDLNTIKTAINDFTTAYNGVRSFIADQREERDRNNDGKVDDNEVGPLAYNQTVRDVAAKLSELTATTISGNVDGYRSLSQIGISVEKDFTLKIDDSKIDPKLLGNVDAVRKLFGFTAVTSDSRITVQARTADTQTGTTYLNVAGTDPAGNILSANMRSTAGSGAGGAGDTTLNATGRDITVLETSAKGLKMFFNGGSSAPVTNDISINITRGIADSFYDYFNDMTKPTSGQLDVLVTQIQSQNKTFTDRIATIDDRLASTRTALEAKYTAMEVALAKLENLKNTITSYTDAQKSSSN